MENNILMMAFARGNESTEGAAFKLYQGVGAVNVLAVNPTKEELKKLYNADIENAPEYVGSVDIDGTSVPNVRIDFIVKTVPEKNNGIDYTSKITFFLRKDVRFNRDKTKVQVIDKYGRTCWVTLEQAKNREIPIYSNGKPANIDKDYRPCHIGEEDLTNFIKAYLNIPNVMKYVNNEWVLVDNPEDSEARLESIDKYFNGDFSELRAILKLQPNNKVKLLFGVRTTDDNRQFQAFYTQMALKNSINDYSKLDKDVQERKNNGAYPSTEFVVCPLKEYTVGATKFEEKEAGDLPFGSGDSATPWEF